MSKRISKILLENSIIFILLPIMLFFVFLKPILPENNSTKIITLLKTARINIKNLGLPNNAVQITQLNKNNARIWEPKWYADKLGKGIQIEIADNQATFRIKCINNGNLLINLLGIDYTNNNQRHPIWIKYTKCLVNGKNILDTFPTNAWHDNNFKYEINVKDNEELLLEINWDIYNFTEKELNELIDIFSIKEKKIINEKERKIIKNRIKKIIDKSQKPKQQD